MSLSHLSVYFVKATSSCNVTITLCAVMYSSYYYVFHTHWYLQCTDGLIMNPSITMILDILISVLNHIIHYYMAYHTGYRTI